MALLEGGASIETVSILLGHSSIRVTEKALQSVGKDPPRRLRQGGSERHTLVKLLYKSGTIFFKYIKNI